MIDLKPNNAYDWCRHCISDDGEEIKTRLLFFTDDTEINLWALFGKCINLDYAHGKQLDWFRKVSLFRIKNLTKNPVNFITRDITFLDNSLLRPDNVFLLRGGYIKRLDRCTYRSLNKDHNLMDMYKKGEFFDPSLSNFRGM